MTYPNTHSNLFALITLLGTLFLAALKLITRRK